MNNKKLNSFLFFGFLLTFYAVQDLPEFIIFYHGVALLIGITSLILALIEYKKHQDKS
jgi:mannose/fructose/N-acetylgalactosamine-specific phosphotransferase system component IIC